MDRLTARNLRQSEDEKCELRSSLTDIIWITYLQGHLVNDVKSSEVLNHWKLHCGTN